MLKIMCRPLRIELPGGLYHVTSRGDRREDIYRNDQDRVEWLTGLDQTELSFDIETTPSAKQAEALRLVDAIGL